MGKLLHFEKMAVLEVSEISDRYRNDVIFIQKCGRREVDHST